LQKPPHYHGFLENTHVLLKLEETPPGLLNSAEITIVLLQYFTISVEFEVQNFYYILVNSSVFFINFNRTEEFIVKSYNRTRVFSAKFNSAEGFFFYSFQ